MNSEDCKSYSMLNKNSVFIGHLLTMNVNTEETSTRFRSHTLENQARAIECKECDKLRSDTIENQAKAIECRECDNLNINYSTEDGFVSPINIMSDE